MNNNNIVSIKWISLYTVLLVLIYLSLTSRSAHAEEVTVFGPEIYQHSNTIRFHRIRLNVDDPNAAYRLIIENGNFAETDTLRGRVILNGVAIGNFRKDDLHLEIPVTLLEQNRLYFKLLGREGNVISVSVVRLDNFQPEADAGEDITTLVDSNVTLDGSGSVDADGDLLSYQWSISAKPLESLAELINPDTVNPTIQIDWPGIYDIQLVVNDGLLDSQPDHVLISTDNSAPVAVTGGDVTPFVNETVFLDGSQSFDVDGDELTYNWSLTLKPENSQTSLNQSNSANPNLQIDKAGHYTVQLVVNDGLLDSDPEHLAIDTLNSKPVAEAGENQDVFLGNTVNLDGSVSFDIDEDPLSYDWSLISIPVSSNTQILDPMSPTPSFSPDIAGTYIVQLIVNDGFLNSEPDTATMTVSVANNPPFITSSPDRFVIADTTYVYFVTATDADNDVLSYSLTASPAGMTIDSSSGEINWAPNIVGDFAVTLKVTDGKGGENSQSYTLHVLSGAGDEDGDGLTNFEELGLGTDPTNHDTDGDGFNDLDEVNHGSDPLDERSLPPSVSMTFFSVFNQAAPGYAQGQVLGNFTTIYNRATPIGKQNEIGIIYTIENQAIPELLNGQAVSAVVSIENTAE